jgi:hypothetical protein
MNVSAPAKRFFHLLHGRDGFTLERCNSLDRTKQKFHEVAGAILGRAATAIEPSDVRSEGQKFCAGFLRALDQSTNGQILTRNLRRIIGTDDQQMKVNLHRILPESFSTQCSVEGSTGLAMLAIQFGQFIKALGGKEPRLRLTQNDDITIRNLALLRDMAKGLAF